MKFSLKKVVAETDNEAVAFYRRCGFVIKGLGEKYPGIERFQAVWELEDELQYAGADWPVQHSAALSLSPL